MEELNFGKYIRKARMELGLSLSELGSRLDCSAPYLSALENGKEQPAENMIKKLSKVLKADYEELLKRSFVIQLENMTAIPHEDREAILAFYRRHISNKSSSYSSNNVRQKLGGVK